MSRRRSSRTSASLQRQDRGVIATRGNTSSTSNTSMPSGASTRRTAPSTPRRREDPFSRNWFVNQTWNPVTASNTSSELFNGPDASNNSNRSTAMNSGDPFNFFEIDFPQLVTRTTTDSTATDSTATDSTAWIDELGEEQINSSLAWLAVPSSRSSPLLPPFPASSAVQTSSPPPRRFGNNQTRSSSTSMLSRSSTHNESARNRSASLQHFQSPSQPMRGYPSILEDQEITDEPVPYATPTSASGLSALTAPSFGRSSNEVEDYFDFLQLTNPSPVNHRNVNTDVDEDAMSESSVSEEE